MVIIKETLYIYAIAVNARNTDLYSFSAQMRREFTNCNWFATRQYLKVSPELQRLARIVECVLQPVYEPRHEISNNLTF